MKVSQPQYRATISLKSDTLIRELIEWLAPILDDENASRVVRESLKAAKAAMDAGVSPADFISGNYHVGKK
jgi:hypothetical protein